MKHFWKYCLCMVLLGAASCNELNDPDSPDNPGEVDFLPTFDYEIYGWHGETATDAAQDIIGTDAGIYYEANTFSHIVRVTYNGANAEVSSNNSNIISHVEGAYVTIDMLTHAVSGVEIVLQGETTDGALKVYGNNKYKLTLNGVKIESQRGAAINNQCKKAVFIHLADGYYNSLTDATTYTGDTYYINPSAQEDCKACFFSEGNMLFSGTGVLKIAGRYNHAIATDDFLNLRPGSTILITEAAKNGIQAKGDNKTLLGINIMGGLIYANVASPAGKALKSDLAINVQGGQLLLNVSGDGDYDATKNDTSSAACIKTDTNLSISGGKHTLKSTGLGGKGINADGAIVINGGETTISTSGADYIYSSTIGSSPKAVKAVGNITINGGIFNVSAAGESDGAEGLDCAGILTINGGETFVHAYDDAVNISTAINIANGKIYAYSVTKDGIDTNGTLTVNGGITIGVGSSNSKSGIKVSESSKFVVNGGTVISLGGAMESEQSSASAQYGASCKVSSAKTGETLSAVGSNEHVAFSLKVPRYFTNEIAYFSSPGVSNEATYTTTTELTPSTSNNWCGLFIAQTIF